MPDDDPYRCRWCGRRDPVASLVADHQAVCVARPASQD